MRSGIHDFWTWLEQGRKDHTEAMFESDTRERNTDTATITEDVTMKQEHVRVTLTLVVWHRQKESKELVLVRRWEIIFFGKKNGVWGFWKNGVFYTKNGAFLHLLLVCTIFFVYIVYTLFVRFSDCSLTVPRHHVLVTCCVFYCHLEKKTYCGPRSETMQSPE